MNKPLAIVTGASSGIGLELATVCAIEGFDLLIAADRPDIWTVADDLRVLGADVTAVNVDLASRRGVDRLCAELDNRPIDALLANAAHGVGQSFLDQDFDEVRHLIDTNVTGTLYLAHLVGQAMRGQGSGRILLNGMATACVPGACRAVYHGTRAFIGAFAGALRAELKGSGVTLTCLMPGACDTEAVSRTGAPEIAMIQGPTSDPAEMARVGFDAMMRGDA